MGYASRRDHLIENGFNDPQQHALLIEELKHSDSRGGAGRRAQSDRDVRQSARTERCGWDCELRGGLSKVAPVAAAHGVTVCGSS